ASAQSVISHLESQQQTERLAGWMTRSQDLFEKKRYDESRAELKRVLHEVPDHQAANALMARLRELELKTEKRKDTVSAVKTALQFYREGKPQAAVLEFQKALETDPANKQAAAYLKAIQGELENQAKARDAYQRAVHLQGAGDLSGAYSSAGEALQFD